MHFQCVHCGHVASMTVRPSAAQRCPHCQRANAFSASSEASRTGSSSLPFPTSSAQPPHTSRFRSILENSLSTLVSLVLHMALFLLLALLSDGGRGVAGTADDVMIGVLPTEVLTERPEESLQPEEASSSEHAAPADEVLEVPTPRIAVADASGGDELAVGPPSLSGGDSGSFDLGKVSAGGGSGGGGSWEGMLQSLRRNGLDIVLTFDSTGSMGGEIGQVKQQIRRIGGTLIKLIPEARIGICTYRDEGDEYVVRGLPLTGNIQDVDKFLAGVSANGGGDQPEAVHEGLRWSMSYNEFRPRARKVILLFGDAPPHTEHFRFCLRLASDFNGQRKGVVSTVTCRSPQRMREFVDIAYAGGGEAFLTTDERQIMTQLLVLVFGSQYRTKVIEAFDLLEKP